MVTMILETLFLQPLHRKKKQLHFNKFSPIPFNSNIDTQLYFFQLLSFMLLLLCYFSAVLHSIVRMELKNFKYAKIKILN